VSRESLAPRIGELGTIVFTPTWIALAVVALPFLAGLAVPSWVQYVPFLVSVLVLGLPHGAVDHLAAARVGRIDRPLAVVAALYLVAGGGYLLVWLVAPAASFVFFIALTWFHWGQGDLYVLVASPTRTHLRSPVQRALCVLVRGGLPMIVPLLAFPGVYREVARAVTELFDPGAITALEPFFSLPARLALGGGLAALSIAALAIGYRRADEGDGERKRAWRLDAGETALLWAYFLVVPPVLAVGLYFCLWHSLRHVVRVIALGDGTEIEGEKRVGNERWGREGDGIEGLRAPGVGAEFARFAREAAPLTAGALVIFAGLYLLAPVGDVSGLIALYLVLLAVLTLPHVLVVTWMDVQQGIW